MRKRAILKIGKTIITPKAVVLSQSTRKQSLQAKEAIVASSLDVL